MAAKDINVKLAGALLAGTLPITEEEDFFLKEAFNESDYPAGRLAYTLRTRLRLRKLRVSAVLGVDARSFKRFHDAIELSEFLKFKIDEAISAVPVVQGSDLPVEIPDGLPFQERNKLKLKMALEGIMDNIITDPSKIYEASLEESAGAFAKLHNALRLEQNQSTENKVTVIRNDPNQKKDEQSEISELTTMLKDLKEKL